MQNHSRTSEVKGCGPILEHEISYIGSLKLGFTIHWEKNDFLQPSDRQNFANALGQNCIHDFRLRRMHRDLWNVVSAYQEQCGFTVDTIVKHMKLNTGLEIPGTHHPKLTNFQEDPSS